MARSITAYLVDGTPTQRPGTQSVPCAYTFSTSVQEESVVVLVADRLNASRRESTSQKSVSARWWQYSGCWQRRHRHWSPRIGPVAPVGSPPTASALARQFHQQLSLLSRQRSSIAVRNTGTTTLARRAQTVPSRNFTRFLPVIQHDVGHTSTQRKYQYPSPSASIHTTLFTGSNPRIKAWTQLREVDGEF